MKNPSAIKYMVSGMVFILLLVCAGSAFAALPPTEVVLNKSVLLKLNNPVERISVAKPEIADVTLISPQQIQITGLALGVTTLIVWERGTGKTTIFDIHVIGDVDFIEQKIKDEIAAPNDDIRVTYANESIVLSGKAHNQETINKAAELALAYAAKEVVRKETRQDGTVTDVTAKLFVNHIVIDEPQQVLLQVKVAQVDKTAMKKLGISGIVKNRNGEGFTNLIGAPSGGATTLGSSSSTGGTTTPIGQGTGISANVPGLGSFNPLDAFTMGISYFPSGIGAVLQALTTKGLAKILAEPNLVVKSGKLGRFHAGSQIPYQVLVSQGGSATTSISWQDVGIDLVFAPEVLDNGVIKLTLDPAKVSSLGNILQANGYPIINDRYVNTSVEMRDGECFVLAGLLQQDEIRSMSKIPLLGDIPILGALFRATDKELTETELVFFITPKIVKPMAPGTKQEMPTDKRLTPEQEKELRWMPLGK